MAWKFQYTESFQKKRFQARDISWNIPVERGRNKQALEKKTVFQNFTLWRAFLKSCVFGDENESIVKSFISSIIYMTPNSTEVFMSNREHIKAEGQLLSLKIVNKEMQLWMNLYKVGYIFKARPTFYWLNKLCRAPLQFVFKKKWKSGLYFKKKRLEKKNDNNQNQSAGCTHYLTNKQILILSNYSQVFLSE